MESGRSSVSFHNDPTLQNKKSSIAFTLPPCLPGPTPRDNSIMIPPFHTHPNQIETFLVTAGTALFQLNQKLIPIKAGNTIEIPRGEYHRFTNASLTERMILEAWYDPADLKREERFFRNLCGFLEDVRSDEGGMSDNASVPQLALFAWEADMMMCAPMVALNVPHFIGDPVSAVLTWLVGVFIGSWMLGYKRSYEEYYHEAAQ